MKKELKHLLLFALLNIPFIIQSDLRWRGYKAYYILGSQVNQMCLYLCCDTYNHMYTVQIFCATIILLNLDTFLIKKLFNGVNLEINSDKWCSQSWML